MNSGRLAQLRSYLERWPLSELLAGLGFFVHAVLEWGQVHGQRSVLDEGLYLYKGWLFASGRFFPFEDYGPYTNHMPLSFLIPGWVQAIFGPGMRTGRMMAYVLGLVMLVGLWIVCRRFAGRWWAAVPLWLVALNPFLTKVYAQALSQVLIVALLVWVLVLTLGRERPTWQWVLGSGLAGVVALTRLNLMPLPILLVIYLFWVHGRRRGWYALAAAGGVLLVGHLVFWPGILKLWAYWISRGPTPFLEAWREPANTIFSWSPGYAAGTRWRVFVTGVRRHLAPMLGVLAAVFTWPRLKSNERTSDASKAVIFVAVLFIALTAEHAWAALGNDYCVYCFQTYLAFFTPIGLLVLVVVANRWIPKLPVSHAVILILLAFLLALFIGGTNIESAVRSMAATQVPRISNLRLRPGTTDISALLAIKLGLVKTTLYRLLEAGFLLWIVGTLLALGYTAYRIGRSWPRSTLSHRLSWILAFSLALWVIPDGIHIGNSFPTYDCGMDVISAVEQAGVQIDEAVEPGSMVYWKGPSSPVVLLHAPDVRVYPPQLNRVYSYRLNGVPTTLYRLSLWNPRLDARWRAEADYLLVTAEYHDERIADALGKFDYDRLTPTVPANPCRPETSIYIYRRIR